MFTAHAGGIPVPQQGRPAPQASRPPPRRERVSLALIAILLVTACAPIRTAPPPLPDESGYDLWLRHAEIEDASARAALHGAFRAILVHDDGPTLNAARRELQSGLERMLGAEVPLVEDADADGLVVAGTPAGSALIADLPLAAELASLGPEGFLIRTVAIDGHRATVIAASGESGVLYGVFHLLRLIRTGSATGPLEVASRPRMDLRLLNHWDNLDGSIERGYAGPSIWRWADLPQRIDARLVDYARANASIGINGVVLNNVNADPRILRSDYMPRVAAIADVFRPYGIRVYLAANFGVPLPPSVTPDES